jgi:hypothetical protein
VTNARDGSNRLFVVEQGGVIKVLQDAVEEIDIITPGGNYGWRIWEGTRCTGNDPGLCTQADFIFPITEYDHTAGRYSVTGGYVYRGARSSLPGGAYVYGDFCTGEVFVFQNGASKGSRETGIICGGQTWP